MVIPAQTSDDQTPPDESVAATEDRTSLAPLPLTPLEAFLHQCDTPKSAMVIRVILRLTGECQLDPCVETMQRAIRRHPMLCSRLHRIDGKLCWVSGEPEPTSVSTQPGSIFEVECGLMTKTIDLTQSAGLHTSITIMDDGIRVVLDAHHAATDGNGIRQIVTDWLTMYHAEVSGTPAKLTEYAPDRLRTRDQFPQTKSVGPISLKDAIRNFLVTIRGKTSRWVTLSPRPHLAAASACSHCVEVILSDAQEKQVLERLSAWKVHINDMVMVCGMSVFARLATPGAMSHRVTVLNPVELRRPSDRDLPAVNRFGFAFMRRKRSECLDPASILRGIQGEMHYVRSNFIGVEFIKGLATASKIPGGIGFFRSLKLFIPSFQATCLGDVTRGLRRTLPWQDGFPVAGRLRWEASTGFAPPADPVPVSISTCETNQRIALAIRTSPYFLTMEQTKAFTSDLVELLCSFPRPEVQHSPGDNVDSP